MRDLFFRQSRLSIDQVDRLKKRVETNQAKHSTISVDQHKGAEAEKLAHTIETDQATIAVQLSRRLYIRAW